ncbi:HAD hydrolase-like protein, partial [Mycobacterium tuberculosis]
RAALVVGDRLDTDIEGANAAGLPSLMVLTGVNSAWDAVYAEPVRRPTYIGHDLRSLHQDSKLLAVAPQPGWQIDVGGGAVTVCANGDVDDLEFIDDGLSIVRAVASAVWEARAADLHQRPLRIEAGDERARAALQRWSLMRSDHPVTSVGTQ